MKSIADIVDVLLEDSGIDLDQFVRDAGIMSPGKKVAAAFEKDKAEFIDSGLRRANRSQQLWITTAPVKFGVGEYYVNHNLATLKTYCRGTAELPSRVSDVFPLLKAYADSRPVQIKKTITSASDPSSVEEAIDRIYKWVGVQLAKWDDLAYIRTAHRGLPDDKVKSIMSEFRTVFNFSSNIVQWESNVCGFASSSISVTTAKKMRQWLEKRVAEEAPVVEDEAQDMEMDKFLRDSGVVVEWDDFITNESSGGFGRWSTGNYTYAVYYKRLTIKGKPVYLGSVFGAHDYNRTGHSGLVSFWAEPPSRSWEYNPKDKWGRAVYKHPQPRKNYGWGAVHMDAPDVSKSNFDNLFDACKYLLSLLRVSNKRLKPI